MKRELEHVEIPGEHEARERGWRVAEAAFAERQPTLRRGRQRLVPAIVIVTLAAVIAGALTSQGRALVRTIRETVGVERAAPALFSLPTPGRLLVASDGGVWIVQTDGSKRRLGAYTSASWSPNGLFVAATRRDALFALTPSGQERWSIARPNVRFPRWTGSRTDTRLAYLSGHEPQIVAGDGTADHAACIRKGALVAPAWRPGPERVLALVGPSGAVLVYRADSCTLLWRARSGGRPTKLQWSSDGRTLLAFASRGLRVYDGNGHVIAQDDPSDATRDSDATFLPGTHDVAVIRVAGAGSNVFVLHDHTARQVFSGGTFTQLVPSPDGRRLLVAWPAADQWVFVPVRGGRLSAVANVSAQFRSRNFPRIEGWCCAP